MSRAVFADLHACYEGKLSDLLAGVQTPDCRDAAQLQCTVVLSRAQLSDVF